MVTRILIWTLVAFVVGVLVLVIGLAVNGELRREEDGDPPV